MTKYYERARQKGELDVGERAPSHGPAQVWKTLRKPSIHFEAHGRRVEFSIYWSPTWDEEHGVYAYLSPRATIRGVGQRD